MPSDGPGKRNAASANLVARLAEAGAEPPAEGEGGQHGQTDADLGHRADDEADEGADPNLAGLQQVAACQIFPDCRADQRAQDHAGQPQDQPDDAADGSPPQRLPAGPGGTGPQHAGEEVDQQAQCSQHRQRDQDGRAHMDETVHPGREEKACQNQRQARQCGKKGTGHPHDDQHDGGKIAQPLHRCLLMMLS